MLKSDDYLRILQARKRGMSVRQIGRTYCHSRRTVKNVIDNPTPRDYARRKNSLPSLMESFKPLISDFVKQSANALGLRTVTAVQVFDYLRKNHLYPGSYSTVSKYLRGAFPFAGSPRNGPIETIGVLPSRPIKLVLAPMGADAIEGAPTMGPQEAPGGEWEGTAGSGKNGSKGNHRLGHTWFLDLYLRKTLTFEEGKRRLTEKEVSFISEILANGILRQRRRAVTIILHTLGVSLRGTASALGCSRKTVARYWDDYRNKGIESIRGHRKPVPREADDERTRKAVFSVLHAPPSSHDVNRSTWRMEDLKRVLGQQGHPVSAPVIREILRSAGY